jgi:cytochrome c biogenesis protein CcmG, thiol:disulfide interchange protein DsbE
MTKSNRGNYFFLYFLLLCFFAACQRKDGIAKGEKAPDFETTDLKGNKVTLSAYKGKVVMLYFWADFCPTCQKEFPATQAYYEKLKGKDFELLAINVGEPASASKKFREKYGATFPMLLDTTKKISETFGIKELPTNYFVTPNGTVARKITGFVGESQVKIMIEQNKLN